MWGRLRAPRDPVPGPEHLVCRAGVHPSQTSATLPDHVQLGSRPGFIDTRLSGSFLLGAQGLRL